MFFSVTLRYQAEVESYFISANRLHRYTQLEIEDELDKPGDKDKKNSVTGEDWPWAGEIEFDKVIMRYRKSLDPCINNLSFKIMPKQKIGIIGRTGAGKSSIFQALFRLFELDQGTIFIDGLNITEVGLHLLRKSIAFIPQQPFLLQGSIRENIDPFNRCSDEVIWEELRSVRLEEYVKGLPDGIKTQVNDNLFSVGQK